MTTSAPRFLTHAVLAVPVVVATCAPRWWASWIAIVPTPPDPAWMRTFWPGCRSARSTSACHAVSATRGAQAPGRAAVEQYVREYLSVQHRDHPGDGCPSAALLDEIGRCTD